jgi:chromosome segregation ATPase
MEITTEAQATKVRTVMAAMIAKLQDAKASGDKEQAAQLKAQYTTLQTALQDYKARERETKAEQRDMMQAYRDIVAGLKDNLKELTQDLKESQDEANAMREQIKTARKTIGDLKFEVARLTDENRTLRAPPPVEEYRKAQIMPMPTAVRFTEEDMMAEIDAITGGQKA